MLSRRELFLLAGALAAPGLALGAQPSSPQPGGWEQNADWMLGLGKGAGRQLLTEEEWREHRATMRGMPPDERLKYRKELQARMRERARERGITLPDAPEPSRPAEARPPATAPRRRGAGRGPSPGGEGG
jgi:hypothetical protein